MPFSEPHSRKASPVSVGVRLLVFLRAIDIYSGLLPLLIHPLRASWALYKGRPVHHAVIPLEHQKEERNIPSGKLGFENLLNYFFTENSLSGEENLILLPKEHVFFLVFFFPSINVFYGFKLV